MVSGLITNKHQNVTPKRCGRSHKNLINLTGCHVMDFRDLLQPLPLACVLHATPTHPKSLLKRAVLPLKISREQF
jgi:hypothetical protein